MASGPETSGTTELLQQQAGMSSPAPPVMGTSGARLMAVGFHNSATGLDLGFYEARSYSLMRPPTPGCRLTCFLGEVGDGVVGPGRVELAATVRSSSVVVGLVVGQDRSQMSLAEDQHPVGDLRSGL